MIAIPPWLIQVFNALLDWLHVNGVPFQAAFAAACGIVLGIVVALRLALAR